jgi:two-component system, NarL family, response regulator NreC
MGGRVISIVLADDHQVVREGLRLLLDGIADFSVLGEESDGLRVVDLVARLRPDVLVVDLMMPGLGGLEVTRRVTKRTPRTRVVILSMHADPAYVWEGLNNGASAYVLKEASAACLTQAVREAAAGRRYISPPLSEADLENYERLRRDAPRDPYHRLTDREREVLHLTAEGLTGPQIAASLGISPRTAETHRANVLKKLQLRGKTDLVHFALERGLVRPGARRSGRAQAGVPPVKIS